MDMSLTTENSVSNSQARSPQTAEAEHPYTPTRARTAKLTKLSIVIPVYNEESTIQDLVAMVVNVPLPAGLAREIICVNDCSRDKTAQKLDDLPRLFRGVDFQIIHKSWNEG